MAGPPEPQPEFEGELPHFRYRDPHIDRLAIFPSAETQPEGTVVFSAYNILLWRFGYAPTDYLQLNLATFPPIIVDGDALIAGELSAKVRIFSNDRGAFALTGGALFGSEDLFDDYAPVPATRVGAVGQLCLVDDCGTLLAAGFQTVLVSGEEESGQAHVPYAGLVAHVTGGFAFLLEPSIWVLVDDVETQSFGLITYGARFNGDRVAFDLGFWRPIADGASEWVFPLGFPFAALSARTYGKLARSTQHPRPQRPRWRPGPTPTPYPDAR